MPSANPTVFISHTHEDEGLALALKGLLEHAFPGALVFVSGRDLTGGRSWFEELRGKLEQSTAIIAVFTRFSLGSKWVHFEAGAGFLTDRTIPLMAEGVTPEDLDYPMRLLHARTFNPDGLRALIRDVARLAGYPPPTKLPKLRDALRNGRQFLALRKTALPRHINEPPTISESEVQYRIRQVEFGAVALRIFAGDASFLDDDPIQRKTVLELGPTAQIMLKPPARERLRIVAECISKGVSVRVYSRTDTPQSIRGCLVQLPEGHRTCLFSRQSDGFKYLEIDHLGVGTVFSRHFKELFERGVNPLIRAVIFDLAGVAFQGDIALFFQKVTDVIGQSVVPRDSDYLCVDPDLNLGRRTVIEWITEKTECTIDPAKQKEIREAWTTTWSRNLAVHSLALRLRNAGYRTAIASNTDRENGDYYRTRQLFAPFDMAFLSYEMGILKPEPDYFLAMARALDLETTQCLVIDDHESNLVAARSVGMATILVERAATPDVKAQEIERQLKSMQLEPF